MKILVISSSAIPSPSPDYSGLENIVANFSIAAAKRGHEVTLLSAKGSSLAGNWQLKNEDGSMSGILRVLETVDPSWTGNSEAAAYNTYRDLLEKDYSDGNSIVWDNTWLGYAYLSAARYPSMKILHTHHGMPNANTAPPGVRFPRILGLSGPHAQLLSSVMGGIPVRHVHNGIPLPPDLSSTSKGEYILSLNRITKEKGIHSSIDVAISQRVPIIVAGDDTHVISQQYVHQIIQQCKNSNGLAKYYGLVDNGTKDALLRGCKAVIACPEQSWMEGFGLFAVEAMAYGKPVLATANGGLTEIIHHRVTGFLANTPEGLKNYVAQLDEIKPDDCRTRAELAFTVDKMASTYIDIFQHVLDNDVAYQW